MQDQASSSTNGNQFRDIILGGQDGLVNILGIVLGLTAAASTERLIIAASLAACFAESISMGAVAFTSFMSQKDYHDSRRRQEQRAILSHPQWEKNAVRKIYLEKGFSGTLLDDIVETITSQQKIWIDNIMNERLHLFAPTKKQIYQSSLTVGIATIIGSVIPLLPFFFFSIHPAVYISVIISSLFLFSIGAYKAYNIEMSWIKSGLQILIIGLIAAFVGYGIGLLFRVTP